MTISTSSASSAKFSASSIFLLVGILLIAANLRAPITSLGPVLSLLQQDFGFNLTQSGLLNALPLLCFAVLSPLAPMLSRSVGLKRALFTALAVIAIGCFFRSDGSVPGLWLGTTCIGIGIAIANVLVVPLVKRDFPQHTALCIGLYAATMALMAAIASGIAAPLADLTEYGWRFSLGIWFVLALLALMIWLPQIIQPRSQILSPNATGKTHSYIWRSAIAWQVSIFMALHTLVFYSVIDWFPSIVKEAGIGATQAGTYLFAYQAIAVVANLMTSIAIKRFNDQRFLGFVCSIAIAIGMLGLLLAPTLALWWLLCAGIGAGMSMVTCLALFGLRTRDHHEAGALSGMAQCVGYGLGSIGPFLTGWLHDISGNWQVPLSVLLVAALIQIIFAVLAGRTRYV
ncbi:MFS transporter [Acinetobacter puyangensis]|uniref:MFS transporter, CP family, cyanate transporter n=1 Tax=Acinetobacter puyangensis TaxID=1096779 RepID=A0A240EG18_9GAMM|nr:MFS transporter [Acinetobacter puyangensis]SNX46880.1 MFS transporter, CP family, cyanate transporter [Acinetobacter puyangensis]